MKKLFNILFNSTRLNILLLFFALNLCFAGRFAEAMYEYKLGTRAFDYWLLSALIDGRYFISTFAFIFISLIALLKISKYNIWSKTTVAIVYFFITTTILATYISAAEFKIRRGMYPTLRDVLTGLSSSEFVGNSKYIFIQERYLLNTIVSILVAIILAVLIYKYANLFFKKFTLPKLLTFIAINIFINILLFRIYLVSHLFLPSIADRESVSMPAFSLIQSVKKYNNNIYAGIRNVFSKLQTNNNVINIGSSMLGLPNITNINSNNCTKHPLQHQWINNTNINPQGVELLSAMKNLSKIIFTNPNITPTVWQVILESFRSYDINTLNSAAPKSLTPYINNLYGNSLSSTPTTLASPLLFQAGQRTSENIAALMCGLGTLPFSLSVERDFGNLLLRCLPDIMHDAGFNSKFYYGSNATFDNRRVFFRKHHVKVLEQKAFDKSLPKGGWGYADNAFMHAFTLQEQNNTTIEPRYNVWLTLSEHEPVVAPEDLSTQDTDAVNNIIKEQNMQLPKEDASRLSVIHYVDRTISELVQKNTSEGIFIISADHSTSDNFFWQNNSSNSYDYAHAKSQIPFVIVFTEPLLKKIPLAAFYKALTQVNTLLQTTPLSSNDIPRLIISLLSSSPQFKNMPPNLQWDSLGGQTTSVNYQKEHTNKYSVWGFNASMYTFGVNNTGKVEDVEKKEPITGDDSFTQPSFYYPITNFLATYIQTYADKCN